jgi:CRISPR/Cas system CSM-associated protein Csm3 (group 7 of RAMP superfamily)
MVKIGIIYRLKLVTPVHVGTGTGGSGFLDKYVYRQGGSPIIPGSTVKGRLRAAVTALARAGVYDAAETCRENGDCTCLVCLIFGCPGQGRGCLYFEDARATESNVDRWLGVRAGISMDRYRRVARDGALYTVETVGGSGVVFEGRISGSVPAEKRDTVVAALKDAFAFNYALGFGKSRGLGWFRAEVIEEEKEKCGMP